MRTISRFASILVLVGVIVPPLFAQDRFSDQIQHQENRLQSFSGKRKVDQLNRLTRLCIRQDAEKAQNYGQRALDLARHLHYESGEALAINSLCRLQLSQSNLKQARVYLDLGAQILREGKDKLNLAHFRNNQCWYFFYQRELERALRFGNEALVLFETLGDRWEMANVLNGIGANLPSFGRSRSALEYHLRSLKIMEDLGEKFGISRSLINIGLIEEDFGQYQRAEKNYLRSLALKEEIDDLQGIATALRCLASVCFKRKEYPRGFAYAQKSLTKFRELGYSRGIAAALGMSGLILKAQGQANEAVEAFSEVLERYQSLGQFVPMGNTLIQLAEIRVDQGRFDAAEGFLNRAIPIGRVEQDAVLLMNGYRVFARLAAEQGEYKTAYEHHRQYLQLYQRVAESEKFRQLQDVQLLQRMRNENDLLKKENEIKSLTRNLFVVGFILVFLVLLFLFKKYLHLFVFWKKEMHVGRYRLLERIGSGGMSVVYRAHSIQSKAELAAVKILKEEFFNDTSTIQRFRQESVIIERLDHPNIVRVFERGEDKGRMFIAMEYLEGKTMSDVIVSTNPIPLDVCAHIMRQLADAVAHLHDRGIIHRDLKPSNIILISRDGDAHFVKLLDFGLARTRFQSTLTKTGEVLGTIGYMSPEQLLDGEVTAASDVYSLGVIFYELVCGRKAFTADNEMAVVKRILDEMPAPPSSLRPKLPGELDRLILEMLTKQSRHRPSLMELLERLKKF